MQPRRLPRKGEGVAAPVRMCVGCRSTADKGSLLRLVRTPAGVVVDAEARAPGRGAYVHRSTACVEATIARGALVRALAADLAADELGRLRRLSEGDA